MDLQVIDNVILVRPQQMTLYQTWHIKNIFIKISDF